MEVAVSFRASFDSNKDITANNLYKMESVLQKWLQDLIAKTGTKELHESLEKASGIKVPTFYLWVLSDIYSAKEQAYLEKVAKGESTDSIGT